MLIYILDIPVLTAIPSDGAMRVWLLLSRVGFYEFAAQFRGSKRMDIATVLAL
jgi:hypothetical protein